MKRVALILTATLALCGCARTPTSSTGSGIEGLVVAGPQCPVERVGSPCPDVPIRATVVVSDSSGVVVTRTNSTERGRFHVAIAPGTYTLTVEGLQGIQSAKPVEVTVPQGTFVRVTVLVDTGIR